MHDNSCKQYCLCDSCALQLCFCRFCLSAVHPTHVKVSACCDLLFESAFCRNCNFTCVQEMMQVLKKNRPKARSAEVAGVTETSRTVSYPVTHQAMHTTGHCAQSNICRHKSAYCCALQDTLHKSSILIMLQTVERHWTSNVMESHALLSECFPFHC